VRVLGAVPDGLACAFAYRRCSDHAFTKTGQAISVDISDCASGLSVTQAAYCSDSDTVTVSVRQSGVPFAIAVTLARQATCA
jgi:hypothetical protein